MNGVCVLVTICAPLFASVSLPVAAEHFGQLRNFRSSNHSVTLFGDGLIVDAQPLQPLGELPGRFRRMLQDRSSNNRPLLLSIEPAGRASVARLGQRLDDG